MEIIAKLILRFLNVYVTKYAVSIGHFLLQKPQGTAPEHEMVERRLERGAVPGDTREAYPRPCRTFCYGPATPFSTADAPPPAVSFSKPIAVPLSVLADARGLKGDVAAKAMRLGHRQKKM